MSTTTTTATDTTRTTPDKNVRPPRISGRPGVAMGRLTHVELRKMVDTRAGRWFLGAIAAVCALVIVAALIWGEVADATYGSLFSLTTLPLVLLLPILGIMTATSEWSQRTGLVTFTLEPHRGRIIVAKVVAGTVLGLVLVAAAFLVAAVGHAVGIAVLDLPGTWALSWSLVLGVVLALTIYVLQGLGFGFLFLNTPLAIVTSLGLPTVWSIAASLVSSLDRVAAWLDLTLVTEPLLAGTMQGSDWAHLGTSTLLWVGIPVALGSWRVLTREVK